MTKDDMDKIIFRQNRSTPVERTVNLALFIAVSAVIQTLENWFFPSSLPLRPGFANVIIILVLARYGPGEALVTAAARSLLAALVSGKFLSVPFFLSLGGGLLSALVMGLLYNRLRDLSVVGVSIAGSFTHNLAQIIIIHLFIIKQNAIFSLLPWLLTMALITGLSVGFTARWLLSLDPFKKLAGHGGIGQVP